MKKIDIDEGATEQKFIIDINDETWKIRLYWHELHTDFIERVGLNIEGHILCDIVNESLGFEVYGKLVTINTPILSRYQLGTNTDFIMLSGREFYTISKNEIVEFGL